MNQSSKRDEREKKKLREKPILQREEREREKKKKKNKGLIWVELAVAHGGCS